MAIVLRGLRSSWLTSASSSLLRSLAWRVASPRAQIVHADDASCASARTMRSSSMVMPRPCVIGNPQHADQRSLVQERNGLRVDD